MPQKNSNFDIVLSILCAQKLGTQIKGLWKFENKRRITGKLWKLIRTTYFYLRFVYVNSTFSVNKGIPMDSKQTKGQK